MDTQVKLIAVAPLIQAAIPADRRARTILQLGVLCLLLTACGDGQPAKVEKGERGPPGPAGPPGSSGTAIRVIVTECRGLCAVRCEPDETILNAYALGGVAGKMVFDDFNRATFRPQGRPTAPIKVVLACIPK
jgi:hypothetical protein